MCDSIANGGPRCVASCPPANVTIASNVLSTTGDIYASNGTFTGTLTVAGNIVGPVSLTNLYVANSVTTTNVYFQNRILSTNLPTFSSAQGTWGSAANVSQVTVDQYGRVSAAANVAITSSQWTTVAGNVAYQNGVSIGTLSAPPVGSNLYVLGTATISNINSNGSGLSSLNAANLSGPASLTNLYVANSVTTTNVTASGTLRVTGAMTSNVDNTTFFFDTFTIPYINSQVGNITTLNVQSIDVLGISNLNSLVTPTANVGTLNVFQISNLNSLTTNLFATSANVGTLNVFQISNLNSLTTNLFATSANVGTLNVFQISNLNSLTTNLFATSANVGTLNVFQISNLNSLTTNLFATSANVGTLNVFQISNLNSLVLLNNIYVANSITTTNLVTAGITSNASNTVFNFDTLTIPFINSTTLNVASTSNLVTAEMRGSLGATTLRVTGNVVVSNALTTQNLISNLVATGNVAPTIASATTIAPTSLVSFVSGTTAIATITAPWPVSTGGTIMLIPTGLWTTTTAGNIALASTAVVFRTVHMTWDFGTSKWYPSY